MRLMIRIVYDKEKEREREREREGGKRKGVEKVNLIDVYLNFLIGDLCRV